MSASRRLSLAILAAVACAPSLARAEAPPALSLGFDGGVGTRSLTYRDDLFGTLRPYSLSAAPVLGGEIAVYPGAFFTHDRPAWIGVAARAEGFVGIDTKRVQHDDSLPTKAWSVTTSLRVRVPFSRGAVHDGAASGPKPRAAYGGALSIDGGFAARAFTIGRAGITEPDLPSVTYLGPRLALGGELRLPLGLSVAPRGALARWVSVGDLASPAWFPNARAWGAELGLRVAWAAGLGLAPYVDVAWTREIAALRPQPGGARVAGGLGDDRFAARLGLSFTLNTRRRD
jgi:hypothetical protein